ncbi:MAG: hypothetical protein SFY66_08405 [Oculatellaceae cyanobacterium bins.114]|nr:hypothetical protein [Oculatellaceae cyanobacterium bins.114]
METSQNPISQKRGCELGDIWSYSVDFEIILVRADIEQVNFALAEIFNGLIEADIDIQESGDKLHALVFQFQGHSWTSFLFFTHRDNLAQKVSEHLKTKCIHFGYGDTTGWAEYTLYQIGERAEAYAFGTNYSEEEVPEWAQDTDGFQDEPVHEFNRSWNLIVTTSDESTRHKFFSVKRRATSTEIQNPDQFLDTLFKEQDAWLPTLKYWFSPEFDPEPDSKLFLQVSKIAYKAII